MASKLEQRRQLFHILSGVFIVTLLTYDFVTRFFLLILLLGTVLFSIISLKFEIPVITWVLKKFDRKKSAFPAAGAISWLVGAILVLYLFPEDIAYSGIIIMSFGDGFATLIGKSGRRKIYGKKTLEGTLAGIAAAFLGAILVIPKLQALLASIVAMLVELSGVKIGKYVDDNIIVTLVASTTVYLFRILT